METTAKHKTSNHSQTVSCIGRKFWRFASITQLFVLSLLMPGRLLAQNLAARGERSDEFHWQRVEEGYYIGRYELGKGNIILKPEVFLLRFDPKLFSFHLALASDFGSKHFDLRTLTRKLSGVAGINAHFFDKNGDPLGVIISDGQQKHRIHRGGSLLTGVFYVFNNQSFIVHRRNFSHIQAQIALQGGPRLIENGKPVQISVSRNHTRRSGIAITKSGDVVLFATLLRFPGASLKQIQLMLLDPSLKISNALNLDGGSSSQLYITRNKLLASDTFISGGDKVPVGLIVKRRKTK